MSVIAIVDVPLPGGRCAAEPIAGRPLVHWPARAAAGAAGIDRIVVRTGDPTVAAAARLVPRVEIAAAAPAAGGDPRAELAAPDDVVVALSADRPVVSAGDIDRALAARRAAGAPAVVAAAGGGGACWAADAGGVLRRGAPGPCLAETGALRIASGAAWAAGADEPAIAVDLGASPAIDRADDWPIVEAHLVRRRQRRLAGIRLLATDVDGTLTDAGMFYGREGEALKRFDTRDAAGMLRLRADCGVELGVITAENSPSVHTRMEKLKIGRYAPGTKDKVAVLRAWCGELGIGFDQVAYIGDDMNDLPALRLAGVAACPADADPEVVAASDLVMPARGGRGAVRRFADAIRAAIRGRT